MASSPCSLLDGLYCEEEKWENDEEMNNEEEEVNMMSHIIRPFVLLEQHDMFWDDDELQSLFAKEKQQGVVFKNNNKDNVSLSFTSRKESVEWMLRVNSYYGFSALTSILSVNYFDRCISGIPFIDESKPWTVQLAAVACVSLAAKVEETHVPFLLDLQVEGAKVVFEPKDIQKMEVLVLSTLEWKMHPVTPISFLDHIIRRLGLNNNQIHWEFLKKCEGLLLSLLSDWRFVSYLPSVLAAATMMHVIDQIEPCNPLEYKSQLMNVFNISKDTVNDCYQLIVETLSGSVTADAPNSKRKLHQMMMDNNSNTTPRSPSGVMDSFWFSESSNDSWEATSDINGGPLSVSSSPMSRKRGRVHEQPMTLQLPSLSRVFMDLVESPR